MNYMNNVSSPAGGEPPHSTNADLDKQMATPNQHQFTIPVGMTAEQAVQNSVAGRTSAQIASEIDQRLRHVSPELRAAVESTIDYAAAKTNELVRLMDNRIREQDGTIAELNGQMLNVHHYAVSQAVDNSESHEHLVEAKQIFGTIEERFAHMNEKLQETLRQDRARVNNAISFHKHSDKRIQDELEYQVPKAKEELKVFLEQLVANAMRDLEARIAQEFAKNQAELEEKCKKLEKEIASEREERNKEREEMNAWKAQMEALVSHRG
ncbi:hypothetical protein CkaCkLH20_05242 [Colletotrichum karsti]|uniref:Uncharacterized protein n=1 Tax=Colletotrichum karsti TaxID=1095194 RepID=A0A9P6I617_9PEZI|nr:uncharacterized protein CkaCkLH20_05242 [Colletotrichum karsti]KAF9877542.1 hypothetical protein CkaCkLH20_05242 [Colletotrichum karsti]